jgi:hypothetical protein
MADLSTMMTTDAAVDAARKAERERAALIAEALAGRWEARARKIREDHTARFFWFGPPYVTPVWEGHARTIDAAAHGLRTVARLVRDPSITIEAVRNSHR